MDNHNIMNNSLKSEKEKMIDEELYYSVDQELLKLRKECRIKLREYNFISFYKLRLAHRRFLVA